MESSLNSQYLIKILRCQTYKMLSNMLNPVKFIQSTDGLPRYWKGLAELCSIEPYIIFNLESNFDPTKEILKIWQENVQKEATIQQLVNYLEKLERFDIIDDLEPLIAEDLLLYHQVLNDETIYQGQNLNVLLTNGVDIKRYDAFVLFADEDTEFATEVIETMENQYNLKLCVKDRDLLGGTFEHLAVIKLITESCDKLIVILSPSFFTSTMNKFFLNFTQAVSLEQRKIIPCLYKYCPDMPPEMRCYFMLDYTKSKVFNFWEKLYESIQTREIQSASKEPQRQLLKNNRPENNQISVRLPSRNQIIRDSNEIPNNSKSQEKCKKKKWFKKGNWFIGKFEKGENSKAEDNRHAFECMKKYAVECK